MSAIAPSVSIIEDVKLIKQIERLPSFFPLDLSRDDPNKQRIRLAYPLGVEVTELRTNKQHTPSRLSLSLSRARSLARSLSVPLSVSPSISLSPLFLSRILSRSLVSGVSGLFRFQKAVAESGCEPKSQKH